MPRPPAETVMTQLFLQLKQELIDEMRSTMSTSNEENRRLIQQLTQLLLQRTSTAAVAVPPPATVSLLSPALPEANKSVPSPEQVPECELQSDAQNMQSAIALDQPTESPEQPDTSQSAAPKGPMDRGSTWVSENTPKVAAKASVNINALRHDSGFFVTLTDSHWFQATSFVMIMMNAVYIGVEADWNDQKDLRSYAWPYQLCEHSFCIFFTLEVVARFLAFRIKIDCLKDSWFVFDSAMVLLMVVDTWILGLLVSFIMNAPGTDTGAVGGVGRLLRLLRLIRISRLASVIPELVTMAKGMIAAIRAVHAALLILFILIYVFAILMNFLIGEEEEAAEYFPSVRESMVTLLVNAVFLDDFSALVQTMIALGNVPSILLLCLFVLLGALTVMNMLIGVLCQVVLDVSAEEEENNVKAQMAKSLLVMLEDLDDDKSGQLSKSEVQDVICEPEAVAIMKDIQVDTNHLLDLTEMLYASPDSTLPIGTFMNILLALRGKRTVTMNDLAKANNFMMWALETQLTQHRELMTQAVVDAFRSYQEASVGAIENHSERVKEYHKDLKEIHTTFQTQHRQTAQSAGVY